MTKIHLNQNKARVTIAAVAQEAGVSKATVSRFLNHRDTLLSQDIAARVEKAINLLGYIPSPVAQSLKRGNTRLIGLVFADISNPYSVAVLKGAEEAAQQEGYQVMVFNLGNACERERLAIQSLASYQVDGFILNTLGQDNAASLEIQKYGKPTVLVDRKHTDLALDLVSLDHADAVNQVVNHLYQNGWREFVYITETVKNISSRQDRVTAFNNIINHLDSTSSSTVFELHEKADLAAFLLQLKQKYGSRPLALISGNALVTLQVATVLANLGWQFGEDVGFVGFDETEWAALVGPGLTTIEQPTAEIGRLAINCLLDRLRGQDKSPRTIQLLGRLRARQSSFMHKKK